MLARKTVLRDFNTTVRGALYGVVVDQCGTPRFTAMPKKPPVTVKPLNEDVLSTGALDEQHVSRSDLTERRPDCSSGVAINRYRCSTGWRGGEECQREENGA